MGTLPLRADTTVKTSEANDRVVTVSSTATRLTNYGKTLLTATAAGTYILEAPIPGVRKVIVQNTTSTVIRTVTSPTTTVTFNTTGNTNLTFDTADELIELEGRTTTRWDIISNQGSVGTS